MNCKIILLFNKNGENMDIKLVKNELIKNSERVEQVHYIEINVSKIESVDEELAEKFIKDILSLNCRLNFTVETWKDIKEIIQDKYEKMQRYQKGYLKNDGTIIPLIANYVLEKIFNIELLSYSADLGDIEIVPKGFDSLFLDRDFSIFLCEYKSSISKLNEEGIANRFIDAYKSVFCKESSVISKINEIKTRINENKENKDIIIKNLNQLIVNRRMLENLIDNKECAKFNLCSITKSKVKINTIDMVNRINKKFQKEIFCIEENRKKCHKYDLCEKINKIKVKNIIVIKIPDNFKLEEFYKNVIKKIEGKMHG